MAGEEVVGGIVGFLRLDADDFHREITRAIAEVKVLKGMDARVQVDVDSRKIDGAAASTKKLAGGIRSVTDVNRSLEDATAKVRIAEARLDEVRKSGRSSMSSILSAEHALLKARQLEQDVIFSTYDGNVRLSRSQRELSRTGRMAAGASKALGGAFEGGGGGGGFMSAPVIIGGIVAGMAVLGPVTAAATAAVAGFTGAVGTGILAYQGFKKEVEDGTALGVVLKRELEGIQGEFQSLSKTAAGAMSGDVLAAFGDVQRFLPTINDEVEAFAGHLGRAFRTGTGGLIKGLEVAMPLIEDGGVYAEVLANKFAEFTASPEFKDFVEYARQALPDVVANVSDFAVGMGKLTVALAPVGDQLIALVGFLGDVAGAAAPVVNFFAKANQFTLAGIINSIEDWRGANNDAAQAVDDHTSKVAWLAEGQTPLASALGLTDGALASAEQKHRDTAKAAADATTQMQLEGDAAGLLKQALDALNGDNLNLAQAQSSFDRGVVNLKKSQEGDKPSQSQVDAVANARGRLKVAQERLAEGRAKGVKGARLDSLINGVNTAERALAKAKQTLAGASKEADHSLKGTSEAAVNNRSQLINLAQSAALVAEAYGQQTGSTEKGRQKLIEMRDQIIKNATATGMNKDEVTAFIDEILKVPAKVPPTRLEVEKTQAEKGLAAFQKAIDSLHGKTVTAGVRYAYTGKLPNGGRSLGGGQVMDAGATGGLIHNGIRRFDKGGLITGPGTGTSDSILARIASTGEPIRVANGEFLSTAAATQRNQAALEAGNRGATLGVVGQGGMDPSAMASVIARETAAAVYAGARDGIAGRESSLSMAAKRRRDTGYRTLVRES